MAVADTNQSGETVEESKAKLRGWLNKNMRIELSDGRVLVGIFLCTDQDANVILGSCTENMPNEEGEDSNVIEPRVLGLAMVPGKHIVSIKVDDVTQPSQQQSSQ